MMGADADPARVRVYLTAGFKRPGAHLDHGVVMAVDTVAFGVTGYSLPWDQVGYWAFKIVSGVSSCRSSGGDHGWECFAGGESVWFSHLTRSTALSHLCDSLALGVFIASALS